MKIQHNLFLIVTACLMILLLSSQVFSLSEKVNTQELEKEFAKVFQKNERDMRADTIQRTEKIERFNAPSNHFVIKTRSNSREVDELIKKIAEDFSLVQVHKIPGPDSTSHILRKTIQLENERFVRAALNVEAMQNVVKSYSSQILDFYNEKKYNFSKR